MRKVRAEAELALIMPRQSNVTDRREVILNSQFRKRIYWIVGMADADDSTQGVFFNAKRKSFFFHARTEGRKGLWLYAPQAGCRGHYVTQRAQKPQKGESSAFLACAGGLGFRQFFGNIEKTLKKRKLFVARWWTTAQLYFDHFNFANR